MTQYSFFPALTRAGVDHYVSLFQKSFGKNYKLNSSYLKWLYEENPQGRVVGVDAFMGNELVAHYAAIPRIYTVEGIDSKFLLSVNTATHPEHQRRGLFKTIANSTYEMAASQGFVGVYGVANAKSVGGFTGGLDFEHIGNIRLAFRHIPNQAGKVLSTLKYSQEWVNWRLSSPSANYFILRELSEGILIGTTRAKITFALGVLEWKIIQNNKFILKKRPFFSGIYFTPTFPVYESLVKLPDWLHPSPWHVIFRSLNEPDSATRLKRVAFDGLAMDTF